MCRRKRAIRPVAVLTQQVNLLRARFSMHLIRLGPARSGRLRILGSRSARGLAKQEAAKGPAPPLLRRPVAPVLLALLFASGTAILPAQEQVPNPLSLEQALEFAPAHPRVQLAAPAPTLPRRPPLYLDCHRLAYSHIGGDDLRSRPMDALLSPLASQQLEIMERFFDVLLADLSYARYNEAMAVAYIQYDRANIRRELGQLSELRVAELEAVYRDLLRKQAASEGSQRLTRALLAQALGQPARLPRDLDPPAPPPPATERPDFELVMSNLSVVDGPTGGEVGSGEAARRLLDMERRQQVLELVLRLQALSAAARYAQTEFFRSDLKLDESRTLYEQEVKADLGFSMSRQTKARLLERQVAYCQTLTRAELRALQGKPVWEQIFEDRSQ